MSKTRRTLLTVLLLALVRHPLEVVLASLVPDLAPEPVAGCLAALTGTLLAVALPAWLLHPWRSDRLPRRRTALISIAEGAALALCIRMAGMALDALWQGALDLSVQGMDAPRSVPETLLYAAVMMIVPALAEECFFRGAVLTSLLDGARRWTAILLTTAFFALMHTSLANLPSLLLLSLFLTLLMLRTGRIVAPIAAHLVYNLTAWLPFAPPVWGSLLCGALLAAWLIRTCMRLPRMAHPPMQRTDLLLSGAALAACMASFFL